MSSLVSSTPLPTDSDPRWEILAEGPFPFLLGGELVQGSGPFGSIINPHTRQQIGQFSTPDEQQVAAAVTSARTAFAEGAWSELSGHDRSRLLLRVAEIIDRDKDQLAFLESVDGGKPISGVYYSDIQTSLDALEHYADQARHRSGTAIDTGDANVHHRSVLQPVGVVLEILPWNGPLWTGVQRLAAILAGGNVAILKPAELASASLLHFGSLLAEADLPSGAVQVLPGKGSVVGQQLIESNGVDLVSLTGGLETGAHVLSQTARSIKRTVLELGGKNPSVVFADADLDQAAMWTAMGGFANSGQVCVCASRVLVERASYDLFIDKLVRAVSQMSVGDPLDPNTALGPVNGGDQFDKAWKYIDIGKKTARLVYGGEPYTDPVRQAGWYVPPTIFADVDPRSPLAVDEIFGPVVAVMPFDDEAEALRLANDTQFGLSAGVFTNDLGKAGRMADRLEAGQIYVNQWFPTGGVAIGSEGLKRSGLGGSGMERYLVRKNIFTRLP